MESGASTPRHSIHEAVIRRDARAIAHFLQKQPDCVLQQDSDGRTPLLLAVEKSDFSSVRQLLMAGANVGATDKFGRLVRPHTPRVHASILVRPIYVLLLPLESLLASPHARLE